MCFNDMEQASPCKLMVAAGLESLVPVGAAARPLKPTEMLPTGEPTTFCNRSICSCPGAHKCAVSL
jgi:hypothetical protein